MAVRRHDTRVCILVWQPRLLTAFTAPCVANCTRSCPEGYGGPNCEPIAATGMGAGAAVGLVVALLILLIAAFGFVKHKDNLLNFFAKPTDMRALLDEMVGTGEIQTIRGT